MNWKLGITGISLHLLCYISWMSFGTRSMPISNKDSEIRLIDSPGNKAETILNPDDFDADQFREIDLERLGIKIDEANGKRFEGDIHLPSNMSIHQFVNNSNDVGRAAVRDQWRKWPNAEIPYAIASEYGSYSRRLIAKAFEEFNQKTCLKFVPRDTSKHSDYVFIVPDDGCYSFVGRSGGRQPVSLDSGCIQLGTIIHELMHSAGHFHEQSRPDRDDYIEVLFNNVRAGASDQFDKYSLRTLTDLDLPYDYGSIMHYGPRTFSRNGQPTIKALKDGGSSMGQRQGFSRLDLQKINKLYDCPERSDADWQSANNGDSKKRPSPVDWYGSSVELACANYKWHCFFWKWIGYCKSDPEYMRRNCPKKCNMCDAIASKIPPAQKQETTDQKTANASCFDSNNHCSTWTQLGYCNNDQYGSFMKKTCPNSCQFCSHLDSGNETHTDEQNQCENKLSQSQCDSYAFWGRCTGSSTRDFMAENCKKACKMCN